MKNIMVSEIKNEKHLACFIDILGFSAKLEAANNNKNMLREILKSLNKFYEEFMDEPPYLDESWGITRTFSDCIYISIPEDSLPSKNEASQYDRVGLKLSEIGVAQARLIVNGESAMFIRGGIHFGERVYKDSDTEVSEAYYKAYTLERSVVFPVIGINADFARKLPRLSGFHQHANIPSQGRPNDNYVVTTKLKNGHTIHFLDYLQCFIDENYGYESINKFLRRHKTAIIKAFKENETKNSISIKYSYLAHNYHNVFIQRNNYDASLLIDETDIPKPELINENDE